MSLESPQFPTYTNFREEHAIPVAPHAEQGTLASASSKQGPTPPHWGPHSASPGKVTDDVSTNDDDFHLNSHPPVGHLPTGFHTVATHITPHEAYSSLTTYGAHKVEMWWLKNFLAAIAGGMWVGIFGHACTVGAGGFFGDSSIGNAAAVYVYGAIFPGAFPSIIFTGSDLFTSNTVAMTCYLVSVNFVLRGWLGLLKVWTVSFVGNWCGTLIIASMISMVSESFSEGSGPYKFLCHLGEHKAHASLAGMFVNAIGCNMCVTVATFSILFAKDVAGKFLGMWFPVIAFCVGGFQHVVANMYTLGAASFMSCKLSAWEYIQNIIIVGLGNIVAGVFFTGAVWTILHYPPRAFSYDVFTVKSVDGPPKPQVVRSASKWRAEVHGSVATMLNRAISRNFEV